MSIRITVPWTGITPSETKLGWARSQDWCKEATIFPGTWPLVIITINDDVLIESYDGCELESVGEKWNHVPHYVDQVAHWQNSVIFKNKFNRLTEKEDE